MLKKKSLPAIVAAALAWPLAAAPALAAPRAADTRDGSNAADADLAVDALGVITVTATRTPRAVEDTPGTVTVKTEAELEREVVNDIDDLVRYEPGVSVANGLTRFGLQGFNIRGLDGNRVLIEVDGVRAPDGFAIGDFSNATRDSIDVDLLKRVEIVRGAGSALYGSNALAGVVSFETKDPEDLLRNVPEDRVGPNGGRALLGLKTGYSTDDDGALATLTGAFANDALAAMFGVTHREGHELDNRGEDDAPNSTRTEPNPQDYDLDNGIAKLVLTPGDRHRLEFALESLQSNAQTEVLSARRDQPSGSSTIRTRSLGGDDGFERTRASLDWGIEGLGFFDRADLKLYRQDSRTTQGSLEARDTLNAAGAVTASVERSRRFDFDQDADGVEFAVQRSFDTGTVSHRFLAGLEYIETRTEQQRDGAQRNLLTGAVTTVVGPDAFPVRDFPNSDTTETALFVQDEIALFDQRLLLIPAVRWDRFELEPDPDPVFEADNPGIVPAELDDEAVSPKLGAVYRLSDAWSLNAQYAHGFRAPPYNDVNVGFTNLQFGYTAIPNPNLKSEESDGVELGVRFDDERGYAALALFKNEYDDFIESFVDVGTSPEGLIVFQSQNLTDVSIEGAELSGAWSLAGLAPSLEGLSLRGAVSYARGDVDSADVPLNSIDPAKAVLGIAWQSADDRYGLELVGTGVERKQRINAASAGAQFVPPGFGTLDLLAWWRPVDRVRVNVGLFNLTDREIYDWSDVRGRPANDAAIERFTRPGLNGTLNVRIEF